MQNNCLSNIGKNNFLGSKDSTNCWIKKLVRPSSHPVCRDSYIKKKLNCKFNDKDCSVLHGRTLSIFDEINDHALDDESFETIPQVKIPPKENEVDFVK